MFLVTETTKVVVEEAKSVYEIVTSYHSDFDEDAASTCCTANVYYMGVLQTSFQCCGAGACSCAVGLACGYIQSHGGICPHQQ
jgi:hypothetical protein